ncbi:hypothetical protein D9M68_823040 [compost metagenome]
MCGRRAGGHVLGVDLAGDDRAHQALAAHQRIPGHGGQVQRHQADDDPLVELVPGRHGAGEGFADVPEQRALRHDVIGGEQAAGRLEPDHEQQRHDRQRAQWVVAGWRGAAFQVAGHGRRAPQELCEAGVARAEDPPQQPEQDQAQCRAAEAHVPIHVQAAELHADEGADDTDDERPVE